MKRFLTVALAGVLVLGAGSVAYANICAFDPVPAATLLFPFVAYNYDDGVAGSGTNTLWSITNVSYEAQIVHVTVWTDYSVAILDFNILLTGYDLINLSIRDILRDGQLPVTVIAPHTTQEGVSDDGTWSSRHAAVAAAPVNPPQPEPTLVFESGSAVLGCDKDLNDSYPGLYVTKIPANILGTFKTWLQSSQTATRRFYDCGSGVIPAPGFFSLPGSWFESRTTADDTWMYITADVVDRCNKLFPDESAYYSLGVIENQNVLVGDYTIVNMDERFSEVDNAVHLEADTEIEVVGTPSPINPSYATTFYSRYSNPTFSDFREPLPTAWAVRYTDTILGDGSALETYLRVFKASIAVGTTAARFVPDLSITFGPDSVQATQLVARICLPYTYYTWDDEENVEVTTTRPWSSPTGQEVVPNLLPLETQEVNANQFNLVGPSGWMLFVWPAANGAVDEQAAGDPPVYYQTWMGVKYVKEGDFSGAKDAQVMGNYNCFNDQVLPANGVGYDYVDFGGYVKWNGYSE